MRKQLHRRNRSGQSLVEAAFSIPFMLLCVVAIIYFGRAAYIDHIVLYAAQDGARLAAATPNLSTNTGALDAIRGFGLDNQPTNTNSPIYAALAAANLLSNGNSGNLPAGAYVRILPFDPAETADDQIPAGTIAVRINYPYSLLRNPFTGDSGNVQQVNINMTADSSNKPIKFGDFPITEKATVASSVYQGVN